MKRVTNFAEIRWLLSEIGTTCYLCGVSNLHYQEAIPENVDPIFPDQVVILCKDCSARRRKRPVHAYVSQRFSQVAAEYARLAVLLGKLPTQSEEAAVDVIRAVPKPDQADLWPDDGPEDVVEVVRASPKPNQADLEELVNNWDNAWPNDNA